MHPIDIIVPVYNGLEDLQLCLESLLKYRQALPHEIIVIDDASPDPQVEPYLETMARSHRALTIHRNKQNLGFVATVNRGMSLHKDRDVVLLNSDTQPARNWLDRLHQCATSVDDIGTVTPFSNNATICSFPHFCRDNPLPPNCDLETLDALFACCNENLSIPIPTAVGFCMYIRRSCLDQVGMFDEVSFGRGYGEENDFCMRATRAGWRHLLCADTFVYHKGGASFGAEKSEREKAALRTMNTKHPKYNRLIAKHLREDPAQALRAKISIELARTGNAPVVLHVTHNRGGGTQKHIEELDQFLANTVRSFLLRPASDGTLVLSLGVDKNSSALCFQFPENSNLLLETCRYLGVGRIHFHHIMGIEPWLWTLAEKLHVPLDITLHDYYLINGNPTLTDKHGHFCENRAPHGNQCNSTYPMSGSISKDHWEIQKNKLLNNADRIFAPSHYTAELFHSYFSTLKPIVANHPDWEQDAPYPPPSIPPRKHAEPLRVLVLGVLSREKGADVLEQTAIICKRKNQAIKFILLGYAYRRLNTIVSQRGAYQDAELDQLIANEEPHVIWFPAQWPETYCYTLSAALRSSLPIIAPNFGSFPERMQGRPLTWIKPWQWKPRQWSEFFKQINKQLQDESKCQPQAWPQESPAQQSFTYRTGYIKNTRTTTTLPPNRLLLDKLITRFTNPRLIGSNLTRRERILQKLFRLQQKRVFMAAAQLVPFGIQQRIKRWLSSRPIHEIISE